MCENILMKSLISVSIKASNIAKKCREDDHLLSYLIQEKKESEKNPRFLHDFKTLVDVLVQEVIKHDLCLAFPSLKGKVYGEESNEFTTDDGTVVIELNDDEAETAALLGKLLDDDASKTLASLVYEDVHPECLCDDNLDALLPNNIGVWIDPIDSTSEYIQGKKGDGIPVKSGLPCVTVLIGVFDQETGCPIVGVINQPFSQQLDGVWTGQLIYGYSIGDRHWISHDFSEISEKKVVAVSSSEDEKIKEALYENGYAIAEFAGAGHKLLKIITGDVSAYVLSKPTTYFWDTCAGAAILNASGGGVVDFKSLKPLEYRGGVGVQNCCHSNGIFAYRNLQIKDELIKALNLEK